MLIGDLLLLQAPEVHQPDVYSEWLGDHLNTGGTTACDLTAGCGYHALRFARAGLSTVAIDRNPHAVSLTQQNAVLNGLDERVEARQGDLYSALKGDERFDRIVAWPPLMPAPAEETDDDWWAMANNGGPDGRRVFDRVVTGASQHLTRSGSLWTAHPWYLDLATTRRIAADSGLSVRIRSRATFGIGATSRARLGYLATLGVKPRRANGEFIQDFVVLEMKLRQAELKRRSRDQPVPVRR